MNIRSLGFGDIRECMILWGLILRSLGVPWEVGTFFGSFSPCSLRATSHTRLRARDRYTSSTLIGVKGGAGPSSLHTTPDEPTEYVNARWM